MKLLFTIYHPLGFGGAEVSTKTLAEVLKKQGHEIIIAATKPYAGFDTHCFKDYKKIPSFKYHNLYLSRFLSKIIKEEKIDIIHAHDRLTAIPAILAAKKNKIPIAVHFRDYWFACPKSSCLMPNLKECEKCKLTNLIKCVSPKRFLWDFYKMTYIKIIRNKLNSADIKFANSNAVKNRLLNCGIDKNVITFPILRDFSAFKKKVKISEIKKKFNLSKTVVTFIGGLTYSKGILNMLKIMPNILKKNKNTCFFIVGKGPLLDEIKNIIGENKLENKIILAGQVELSDMPDIYAASDIVLLPSIWAEPLSGVLLEASASGATLISSNTGGSIDVIKDGKTGCLLDPRDLNAWENKINMLLKDAKLRRKLGEQAKITLEKTFDSKKIVKQIENIYENLIKA